MEMTSVSSSFIAAVGFEPDSVDDPTGTGTVTIQFNDGAVFTYAGPTLADYQALLGAPSIGKRFHSDFKRRFTGVRA